MSIYFRFNSSGTSFANLTTVTIGITDTAGFSTAVLEDILQDGRIKLTSSRPAGQNTRPEGFFNVTNFMAVPNDAGTTVALQLTVTPAGTASTIGSVRSGNIGEIDTDFVLVPLSPTAAGDVSGATRAWRDVAADTGTAAVPDGVQDTLRIVGGTDINTNVLDGTEQATVTVNHDTINTTGTLSSTGNTFIQSITVQNGHITAVTPGTVVIPVPDQLITLGYLELVPMYREVHLPKHTQLQTQQDLL